MRHLKLVKTEPHPEAETGTLTDADVMLRVSNGDRAAYAILVERYLHRALAVAQRVVLNRAEAEEIVQDVFLKVWQKAGDWSAEKGAVSTWVYRIALNRALDVVRKVRPQALPEDYDAPDTGTPSAPEQLMANERHAALHDELKKLPERQRAALALSYQVEMSDADAAASMKISVKAYESLLVRARKTLRARLMAGGWHEAE